MITHYSSATRSGFPFLNYTQTYTFSSSSGTGVKTSNRVAGSSSSRISDSTYYSKIASGRSQTTFLNAGTVTVANASGVTESQSGTDSFNAGVNVAYSGSTSYTESANDLNGNYYATTNTASITGRGEGATLTVRYYQAGTTRTTIPAGTDPASSTTFSTTGGIYANTASSLTLSYSYDLYIQTFTTSSIVGSTTTTRKYDFKTSSGASSSPYTTTKSSSFVDATTTSTQITGVPTHSFSTITSWFPFQDILILTTGYNWMLGDVGAILSTTSPSSSYNYSDIGVATSTASFEEVGTSSLKKQITSTPTNLTSSFNFDYIDYVQTTGTFVSIAPFQNSSGFITQYGFSVSRVTSTTFDGFRPTTETYTRTVLSARSTNTSANEFPSSTTVIYAKTTTTSTFWFGSDNTEIETIGGIFTTKATTATVNCGVGTFPYPGGDTYPVSSTATSAGGYLYSEVRQWTAEVTSLDWSTHPLITFKTSALLGDSASLSIAKISPITNVIMQAVYYPETQNKTDRIGYYEFTNSLSFYLQPNKLSYNYYPFNQYYSGLLGQCKYEADNLYKSANLGFTNPPDYWYDDSTQYLLTPISQSSYTFVRQSFTGGSIPLQTSYTLTWVDSIGSFLYTIRTNTATISSGTLSFQYSTPITTQFSYPDVGGRAGANLFGGSITIFFDKKTEQIGFSPLQGFAESFVSKYRPYQTLATSAEFLFYDSSGSTGSVIALSSFETSETSAVCTLSYLPSPLYNYWFEGATAGTYYGFRLPNISQVNYLKAYLLGPSFYLNLFYRTFDKDLNSFTYLS